MRILYLSFKLYIRDYHRFIPNSTRAVYCPSSFTLQTRRLSFSTRQRTGIELHASVTSNGLQKPGIRNLRPEILKPRMTSQ